MSERTADLEAIRRLVAGAVEYQNDPGPFLDLHTDEAIIVNIAGRRVLGKEALTEAMQAALSGPLADVTTTLEIEDIRFTGADVALVSAAKYVHDNRADPAGALPSRGSLTYVVRRDESAWRIALAQTTPVATAR
jgi:uncharacterized protein (TIGR02246 family)